MMQRSKITQSSRIVVTFVFAAMVFIGTPISSNAQACTDPSGVIGQITYNESNDVVQGCTRNAGWVAFHNPIPHPCTGTPTAPAIGETCTDGSIYAGLSPDGNVPMYTTPADAPSFMSWNSGTTTWFDTTMENCTTATPGSKASCRTGEANTALLVGLTTWPAPYKAAVYCDGLSAHGHSDWYLPAQDELTVLYNNRVAIGGFNTSGSFPAGVYCSSSENNHQAVRSQRFSDGFQYDVAKHVGFPVRCVRR